MKLRCKELACEVKADEQKPRTYRFIGSTSTPDRGGDIIDLDGWELDSYKKNPMVLWAHRHHDLPIGKTINVEKDSANKRLLFDIEFASAEDYPFAGTIEKLVKAGFVNAVSVGMLPLKTEEIPFKELPEHLQDSWFPPLHYKQQELVEVSIVSVPMHQDTLRVLNSLERRLLYAKNLERFRDDLNGTEVEREDTPPTVMQTLIFSKEKFKSIAECHAWIDKANENKKESKLHKDKVDETENSYRFRQREPGDFADGSMKTIELDTGVQAVIGHLKKALEIGLVRMELALESMNHNLKIIGDDWLKAIKENSASVATLSQVVRDLALLSELSASDLPKPAKEVEAEDSLKLIMSEINQLQTSLVKK